MKKQLVITALLSFLFCVNVCAQQSRPTSNLDEVAKEVLRLLVDEGVGETPGLGELFDHWLLPTYMQKRGVDIAHHDDSNKFRAALFKIVPPAIFVGALEKLVQEADDLKKEKFPQRVHDRGYSFVYQVAVATKLTPLAVTAAERNNPSHLFVTQPLPADLYGYTVIKKCGLAIADNSGVATIQCQIETTVDLGKFLPTDEVGVSGEMLVAWVQAILFHEMVHIQLNKIYMEKFAARYGWKEGVVPRSDAEKKTLAAMVDKANDDLKRFIKRADIVNLDETFVHLVSSRGLNYSGVARGYFNPKNHGYGISYSNMMVFAQNNATNFARLAKPLDGAGAAGQQSIYDELGEVMTIAFAPLPGPEPIEPLDYLKARRADFDKFATHLLRRFDAKK